MTSVADQKHCTFQIIRMQFNIVATAQVTRSTVSGLNFLEFMIASSEYLSAA